MIIQYNKFSFISHPFALAKFALGRKMDLHERMLVRSAKLLLGKKFDQSLSNQALNEIRAGDFIPMRNIPGVALPGNMPTYLFGKFLYYIVRCARPELMVETGVAHGVSSWTILNAMHRNGTGNLYSIDLPNLDLKSYNPANISQQSGWVVPDILRQRWELQLGPSSELLPALIKRLGKIDIFFHDSDHSYDNMMFEFGAVYDSIKEEGLILSDDVHKNNSFRDFVNSSNICGIQFYTKGGAAVKRRQ
ncbi:MAG: class I SAM-dependent methyltransferase [Bacteroidetes bacterium]|nr:MAG: class I SAM-dependent methyltransferase [Bacteroidota bacterium]REK07248.1 MAG: class I SAM-dependent methyltransferase [Bacteroidota bacterium]REK31765.1 MAG: class I SAM-dependent methyltransferase [Bacteroidota bacterium]REK48055.1 MAG: class I SAM-dependent methyltransferase [Bacteroidota bacterium]